MAVWSGGVGVAMSKRTVIALLAASVTAGASFAADLPITAPQLQRSRLVMPVEWTGIYFGVNAGYGWADGSSTTVFRGALRDGFTASALLNPLLGDPDDPTDVGCLIPGAGPGPCPTELRGRNLSGSGSLKGAIAGGQIGFNWQAGMIVFGLEADGQWSGQQGANTVVCNSTTPCTAAENVRIRSLITARARVGVALDWLMPYVAAGGAWVNVSDDLTLTIGGATANFPSLSNTTLGWTVGGGLEVAFWSNWSAKLEYLYVRADDHDATAGIALILGQGIVAEAGQYRDNIVRFGLNYRFGPRGGPGLLDARAAPFTGYASNYDYLPRLALSRDKAKSMARADEPGSGRVFASAARSDAVPAATEHDVQRAASVASEPKPSKWAPKNFDEIEDDQDTIALPAASKPRKPPSTSRREKEADEGQRLKRIMAICSGC